MRRRVFASVLARGRYQQQAVVLHTERAGLHVRASLRHHGELAEVHEEDEIALRWMCIKQKPSSQAALLEGRRTQDTAELAATSVTQPEGDEEGTSAATPIVFSATHLEFMAPAEVVNFAFALKEFDEWQWPLVASRLKEIEIGPVESVLLLDCMVRLGVRDERLLSKLVDRIEASYYGMELGLPEKAKEDFPVIARFHHIPGDFQSLVNSLPVSHKIKIIHMDDFSREKGTMRKRRAPPAPNPQEKWKTMEPVEMELEERRQFEKGRIKVKRIRNVKAQVTKMRPGKRLRATLGMQLLQAMPGSSGTELAEIAQVSVFPEKRILHGDLLDDFQEELAKHVNALDTQELTPYLLAFTAAFRTFNGPGAWRAWRRKLLPAVIRYIRSPDQLNILSEQKFVHPWMGSVRDPDVLKHDRHANGVAINLLCMQAELASRLFICLATARQLSLDTELYDGLVSPLQTLLVQWLKTHDTKERQLLSLELLADVFAACASCGVNSVRRDNLFLPELLAELFLAQFSTDIHEGNYQQANYAIADLTNIAHSVAVLLEPEPSRESESGLAEEVLGLIWEASKSSLKQSQPHLVLMLLNAVVKGGSEELLTSQPFLDAVDEHLAQKLDYSPEMLGRLGS